MPEDALSLLKELTSVKFDESVDVAINLGIDPKKSDQVVRGSTVLPHGLGKTIRIALFADGPMLKRVQMLVPMWLVWMTWQMI